MTHNNQIPTESHLKVFKDRSVLIDETGQEVVFKEGRPTEETTQRHKRIMQALEQGFLDNVIEQCKSPEKASVSLNEEDIELLDCLVSSVTSEVGRAIVGLSVLQLCVKAIDPSQNIRLHKAGAGDFSWEQGLSMRTIDSRHITPTLRRHGLLRINKDGIMMTRSLAENYPYTPLYKAAMRGAKKEWLAIVDKVENGRLNAKDGLKVVIVALLRRSDAFTSLVSETLEAMENYLVMSPRYEDVSNLIKNHIHSSTYSARLMEIALHSLFQTHAKENVLNGALKPLSQMRSANKKHGNIGDIEVTSHTNPLYIIEAWDSKYGKPYLRDELDELSEKLEIHAETEIAGFVVDTNPDMRLDIIERVSEITDIHNTQIQLKSFDSFIQQQLVRSDSIDTNIYARKWLIAYIESLAQKRRDIAPIDEPCDVWLLSLKHALRQQIK